MAPLRESERKEEIRVLHMEIWDKMQSFDESYAESYYKIWPVLEHEFGRH
jgi:hypothetical protein